MGMGYGASVIDSIDTDEIKKVGKCGDLMNKFENSLKANKTNLSAFAQAMQESGDILSEAIGEICTDPQDQQSIANYYEALVHEFKQETGLRMGVSFHSSENDGSDYDDVDGVYWWIDGFRDISPAGKSAQEKWGIKIENKSFVTFV